MGKIPAALKKYQFKKGMTSTKKSAPMKKSGAKKRK